MKPLDGVTSPLDSIDLGVKSDLIRWRSGLLGADIGGALTGLRKTNLWLGVLLFVCDWILIVASFIVFSKWPLLLPFCLLLAGSRQRALSNLIHDSSHFNLSRNAKVNDLICNFLAGFAMFSPVESYRASHLLHHRHLGHIYRDPDIVMHLRYGYDDSNPPFRKWYQNIFYLLFNIESWKDSILGSFFDLGFIQKIVCIFWWLAFFGVFHAVDGSSTISFILYWLISRATGYHLVRTFAEFFDHSGLPVGSIVKNSRIVHSNSYFAKFLFHPHSDDLHAIHHLDPAIPNFKLRKAYCLTSNKLLIYMEIRKNDGYFLEIYQHPRI